jgi:tetratricopeptide (TPR) repeat protein
MEALVRFLLTYSWLACCLVLAAASPLSAQTAAPTESMAQSTTTDADMTDAQARGHFRLGAELYSKGQFAEAAKEFEVAYGLSGRGSLLYNVYLAYRDAQDTHNAARALRGYLSAVPDAPDKQHLTARLAALDELNKQAEEAAARQKAEAEQAQQQARESERQRIEADQRARAAEQRAEVKPSRPWWPWLVVGGGLAVTGTGIVLGALAASDADELKGECVLDPAAGAGTGAPLMEGNFCAPSVDHESRRDSIQSQALIGDVLWIGGAVITATGLVLAFALPDVYPDEAPPPVTAGCSTQECRATLRLSF